MDTCSKDIGFTLVELIITIFLIPILSLLFYARWPGLGISVNSQANLLAADIRNTQNLAMSRSERYKITISPPSSYQVYNSSNTLYATVTLSNNILFGNITNLVNNSIIFSSDGTPYTDNVFPGIPLTANATIVLIASDKSTATVAVLPETGKVTP